MSDNGFDPNQKRDHSGKWEEYRAPMASGTLTVPNDPTGSDAEYENAMLEVYDSQRQQLRDAHGPDAWRGISVVNAQEVEFRVRRAFPDAAQVNLLVDPDGSWHAVGIIGADGSETGVPADLQRAVDPLISGIYASDDFDPFGPRRHGSDATLHLDAAYRPVPGLGTPQQPDIRHPVPAEVPFDADFDRAPEDPEKLETRAPEDGEVGAVTAVGHDGRLTPIATFERHDASSRPPQAPLDPDDTPSPAASIYNALPQHIKRDIDTGARSYRSVMISTLPKGYQNAVKAGRMTLSAALRRSYAETQSARDERV